MNAPAEKPATADAPAPKPLDQALRAFLQARPVPGAAAVLLAWAAVPAVGLAVSAREGPSLWTWGAALLLAGALVPAAAVFLRRGWAHVPAGFLGWASAVGAALRGLSSGEIPAHIPAVAFGAFLVAAAGAMRPPPPAPASTAPERRPESVEQWVRENLEAIVIAFIMALVIRCFCIEVFKIPSSSMEPTLLGDNKDSHSCPYSKYHVERYPGGDRIMVTKFFYALSDIQRYDVLVFKFPLNQPRNFIKRVVGLPDEKLRIYKGNLFVQKPGERKFAIARRTLRTQDAIWIDLIRGQDFFEDFVFFDKHWEPLPLRPDEGIAEVRFENRELFTQEKDKVRSVRFKFEKPPTDAAYGGQDVGELRIAFEFELTSPQGQVFAEVSNEYGRFELVLSTDGASELRRTQPRETQPLKREQIQGFRLEMDRRYRLDLSVFDGMAYARVDGKVVASFPYLEFREDKAPPPGGEIGLAFGSKDATFRARKLSVGRDIYYKGKDSSGIAEDEEISIRPGHYVMMGDNVDSSHDSRSWKLKRYLLRDGRIVDCESQEIDKTDEVKPEDVMRRYGVETRPDTFIAGDRNGSPWLLYERDRDDLPKGLPVGVIEKSFPVERFYEIPAQNIVGKGLWIWWPPGRWFHLIR